MSGQELVRVSHDEREATATMLREHLAAGYLTIEEFSDRVGLAYAAKTRADLDEVTEGLPDRYETAEIIEPAPEPGGSRSSIGIFSGFSRKGRWRIAARHSVLTICGGGRLDLRQAEFSAHTTEMSCLAIFGGVTIVVPEDVEVDLSGFSIFGGRSFRSKTMPPPGARRIHLHALAICGGVHVVAKP